MFRHKGKSRTDIHNLKLAVLFSFVAGIVNITGFLSVERLTTNVTGHFAYFAAGFVDKQYWQALLYAFYIGSFLLGAFASNFIMELVAGKNAKYIYLIPVNIEIALLLAVALSTPVQTAQHHNIIACALLFAMGLQNALVTGISNAVVRTTHLTGLFTDLGIELSQLFFYKLKEQRKKLYVSIRLRIAIICLFFTGCLLGGLCYFRFGTHTLLLAIACLITGLVYDTVRYKLVTLKRKYVGH